MSCGGEIRRGELIITSNGLEGGAIYALSPVIREVLARQATAELSLDLRPDIPIEGLAQRLAAARIEAFLDRMMAGQAQLVQVPSVLGTALREKYEGRITPAGIDRALERAQAVRTAADSARTANQPSTAIPMPPAGQGPAGQAPTGQVPAAPTPAPQP